MLIPKSYNELAKLTKLFRIFITKVLMHVYFFIPAIFIHLENHGSTLHNNRKIEVCHLISIRAQLNL